MVQAACKSLGITSHRKLPKIHGTRFINHRRRGIKVFLEIWPGIIMAYENALSDPKGKALTKAKIKGFLTKLRSYEFFCKAAYYLDILDAAGPASLVFEGDGLMPYEVDGAIERTCLELEDLEKNAGTDEEFISSNVSLFTVRDDEVIGNYLREGDARRKIENRENIEVVIEGMVPSDAGRARAAQGKKSAALELKAVLQTRFEENQTSDLYQAMDIYDPAYWTDDPRYGEEKIRTIIDHFKIPLTASGFDERIVFTEWRAVRLVVKRQYNDIVLYPKKIWQKIITFKRMEYPNFCLILEIMTCISGSNSSVERSFSTLTLLLSDRRLSMDHQTMQNLMLIKSNDRVWNPKERAEIKSRAVELYLVKRRRTKLETGEKKNKPEDQDGIIPVESSSSDSSDDSDDDTDNEQ